MAASAGNRNFVVFSALGSESIGGVSGNRGIHFVVGNRAAVELDIGNGSIVISGVKGNSTAGSHRAVMCNFAAVHYKLAAPADIYSASDRISIRTAACAGNVAGDGAAVHGKFAIRDQDSAAGLRRDIVAHLCARVHVDFNVRCIVCHGDGAAAVSREVVVDLAIEVDHTAVAFFIRISLRIDDAIGTAIVMDFGVLTNLNLEDTVLRCDHMACAACDLAVQTGRTGNIQGRVTVNIPYHRASLGSKGAAVVRPISAVQIAEHFYGVSRIFETPAVNHTVGAEGCGCTHPHVHNKAACSLPHGVV